MKKLIVGSFFMMFFVTTPLMGNFLISVKPQSINPSDYSSKEEFVVAYVENEISRLSDEERQTDARRLGGDKLRRNKLRRDGERAWKAHVSGKSLVSKGQGGSSQGQSIIDNSDAEYLKGLPLDGLFGIALGEVVDTSMYRRIGNSRTYKFVPKKNFRLYKNYEFSITPITKKVYGIRASGMSYTDAFGNMIDYEAEIMKTRMAFEKRFQKKAKDSHMKSTFYLLFPGDDGKVAREICVKSGSSITAIDIKLKELAEKEYSQALEKEARDGLNEDVEAL